jgi:D-3-phosphoglycerate dehydrogenase
MHSAAGQAPTFRVLVADDLSQAGVELLRSCPDFAVTVRTGMKPDELRATIGEHDALLVRSATKVTADALSSPGKLRVIGRAGTGVDNIDLAAATRAGVVVMNTPGGNSLAAAELTLAHLLALARHLAPAAAEVRAGEWPRKKYVGVELAGKVLGVVGFGRIGREVARRAQAFRMEVLAFDPYVSRDATAGAGVRYATIDELLETSDFVTLHMPLTDDTRRMIDAPALARMKRTASLINCARGGLVDEAALLAALEGGRLAGAGLDVFESEPPSDRRLAAHPLVVATPHLGASTVEAQERVGTEIAEKVRDYLRSGMILDAVNFPSMDRDQAAALGPALELAERLGRLLGQIGDGGVRRLEVRTLGTLADHNLRPLAMAATKGLLSHMLEGGVSYVNALALATERGITVEESRSSERSPYAGLLRLSLATDRAQATVAGTFFAPDQPRLVEVDGVGIEARPAGHMILIRNRDVPGVVGKVGTILGRARVNIAGIQLGRTMGPDGAVSIIAVDGPVPPEALADIAAIPEITFVRAVEV